MSVIDELIRQAMEEGKFSDLPGKGKPLSLEENPFEDPEWRLAYHLLRSNGFSLPWIEAMRAVDSEAEAARQTVREAWSWRLASIEEGLPPGAIEAGWEAARSQFCERLQALNQRILAVNLQIPSARLHLPSLNCDREIEQLTTAPRSDTL